MYSHQIDERTRLRKQKVDLAVALAMQSQWERAVKVNQEIIQLFPKDVDAYNRLGRALTELGRYREARESYQRAVSIDPTNAIARKNLMRLSALTIETLASQPSEKVDPRLFIAETGKTGVTDLVRVARSEVLARMSVGDRVYLHPEGRVLYMRNGRNETLGQVEPKLTQRLIDLMKGGNLYAAAITSITDTSVRIIVREIHQDPSQYGKISFPTRGETLPGVRPYIKASFMRSEPDEDDEEASEEHGLGLESDIEEAEESIDDSDFEDERNVD